MLRQIGDVDAASRDAGEDRNAQVGKPAREMSQHADLIGAPRAASRQDERKLTVIRRAVGKLGDLVGCFDWHVVRE